MLTSLIHSPPFLSSKSESRYLSASSYSIVGRFFSSAIVL
nr:MAG TPA: hypothetical protein [Caudoviricetes sp.]